MILNIRKEMILMDEPNRDYENKLGGFDSAEPENNETKPEQAPRNNEGYTLTPEGGYYENENGNSEQASQPNEDTNMYSSDGVKSDSYIPTGNYSVPDGEYHYVYKKSEQSDSTKAKKPPKKPKRERKPHSFSFAAVIAAVLIAAVISSGCMYMFLNMGTVADKNGTASTSSQSSTETKTEKVVEINGSIEELAETAASKAGSSVVGVQTTFAVQNFFSGNSTSSGSGSGVIYKEDGYIITNYHVIADTLSSDNSTITVYLDNNTDKGYKASVINYNISCDLAVLKIDKTGLNAIDIADSDNLKVGQYVVAIGSPAGLEFMGSTTFGIISGLNRQISTTNGNMKLIQTDAAINPGNSGGALVNTKGELVGISSSKLVNESYEGMGFAIPVNTVVKICDNLIAHEGEGDPYTGISLSYNYTAEILKYYGYPEGAVVSGVDSGSPAAKAGIKRGDIITKYGDTTVGSYTDYESALSEHFPNEKVTVEYYRSGKTYKTTLTVGSVN